MKKNKKSGGISAWFVVKQTGQLGFIIALPLVILIFIGHWLDIKLGFKVFFIFIGMIAALGISSYAIYQKIKKIS